MSLITRGQGLRGLATRGLARAAEIEAQDVRHAMALEAQKKAQQAQTYGAGAGIGAMYGIKNLPPKASSSVGTPEFAVNYEPTEIIQGAENALRGISPPSPTPGIESSVPIDHSGSKVIGDITSSVVPPVEGVTVAGGGGSAAGGSAAVADAAALTEGAAALTEGAVVVEGGALGASGAGGASGPLSTLGSVAAPIAIGLGVAFLLNKLFD